MNILLIIVSIIVLLFILIQIFAYRKSKKTVGQPIPFDIIENEFAEKIRDQKGLIYFYSPTCSNCKVQSPIIEKVKNKNYHIISIDTSKYVNVARAFNVMAIPSILFFNGNKIKGFYVGVKKEDFLLEKFNNI